MVPQLGHAVEGTAKVTPKQSREHVRRLRIRKAALERHKAARDPATGKSALAVAAGQASGIRREGDSAWGLGMSLRRWYPRNGDYRKGGNRPKTLT